jgi:hypothetical protein
MTGSPPSLLLPLPVSLLYTAFEQKELHDRCAGGRAPRRPPV